MKTFAELSPEEILSLAIAIEASNAEHYQEWADRFQPFDTVVSRLLEDLAKEEEVHGKQLIDLYHSRFGKRIGKIKPEEVERQIERPALPDNHFFVVDPDMAHNILWAALRTELKAREFYERLTEQTKDKALLKVYKMLAAFEEDHVQALQNRLAHLKRGINHASPLTDKTALHE
ncbi:MAG: ferritin family protein [Deltaproteobacteria bacterium]|nr:ferritin family protein [Deltaproteobacteria bacterium]